MSIVIEASPVEPIEVELVGKKYTITPPKTALAMRMAVTSKINGDDASAASELVNVWMDKAFGKEVAETVRDRFEDDEDLLDIPHVMQLMEKVFEVQSGNPTS